MALPSFSLVCSRIVGAWGGDLLRRFGFLMRRAVSMLPQGLQLMHFHQLLYLMSCSCVAHLYMYPQLLAETLPLRFTEGMSCLEIS